MPSEPSRPGVSLPWRGRMERADKIVNAPKGANDRPNNPTTIEKIVIRDAKPDEKGPAPTGGR